MNNRLNSIKLLKKIFRVSQCGRQENDGKRFTLNVEIPANTKAVIVIPAADPAMVTVNGRRLITAKIGWGREGQDKLMITTGSGKYHIEVKR
jgi:hypothetical protein